MNAHDAICKAAHDALCKIRTPHIAHVWFSPVPYFDYVADEIEAALSAAGYTITLTDDGAGSGEPAVAAGEAGSIPAGNPAPSSPHQVTELLASTVFHCFDHEEFGLSAKHATAVSDALVAAGFFGEGATPATSHRPTCGTTYGESCDGYCPAPAIDREALTELLRFNRHAPYVSNERLADMVATLIEGAS